MMSSRCRCGVNSASLRGVPAPKQSSSFRPLGRFADARDDDRMIGNRVAQGSEVCEAAAMKADAQIRPVPSSDFAARVDTLDWAQAERELDAQGCGVLKGLLTSEECRALAALYGDDAH